VENLKGGADLDERLHWIGMNMVKGIGPKSFKNALDHFGSAKEAWEASPGSLYDSGMQKKRVESLLQFRASIDLNAIWAGLQEKNIRVLTWKDEEYPRRLRDIRQSPPLLYVRGEITPQDSWAVAVVGTRRITAYGKQVAEELGAALARSGVTVVSGLARGVDSVAHSAALKAGGRTIAVLGCGVDQIYPPENCNLAAKIIENGAVISDYGIGTPPEAGNFPPRNRIIAGLSIATVVIEAGRRSGALITADFALDQGRDVYAVPGNIFLPNSAGPNRLIQQGAFPLISADDLLQSLDLTMVTEHQVARQVLPANAVEAVLFNALEFEPKHIDEIRIDVELPIEDVSAALSLMELKGMVRKVGGMKYVAVKETRAKYQVEKLRLEEVEADQVQEGSSNG
jgi:DNA processing protein